MTDHPPIPPEDGFERHLIAEIRQTFTQPLDPSVRARHLAAMAGVTPEPAPSGRLASSWRRSRRMGVRGAVAAAGLVLVGGSALAATGSLPSPVQNFVAQAVDIVVDIPDGKEKQNARGGNPSNPRAAQNRSEAKAFVAAKKDWLSCMKSSEASASPTATGAAVAIATDSAADCGDKPNPDDFKADKTPKPDKTPKADKPSGTRAPKPDKTPPPEPTTESTATPAPTGTEAPAETAAPVETPEPV